MCRGNSTAVVIISWVDLGVVLSLVPQVIHRMLSRFVPAPQYAEAESCKCEDRVWRCDGVAVEETVGTILWLAVWSVTSFTVLG